MAKNKNTSEPSDKAYEAERKSTVDDVSGRYSKNVDESATPGINTPGIALPAFNPPVPNRAWTAMRMGKDIDELSDEERRELYYGRDGRM